MIAQGTGSAAEPGSTAVMGGYLSLLPLMLIYGRADDPCAER